MNGFFGRLTAIILSAAGITGILIGAAAAADRVPVRIGVQPNILPEVIMRAQGTLEQKYGDKYDFQWLDVTHAAPAIEALVANSIDITDAGVLPLIAGRARGHDYYAVADAVGDVTGLVVRADSGIKTPADLKGKTIAYPGKGSWQYGLLLMALEGSGVKESEINLVRARFPEMHVLMQKGSVDGFAGTEPFMSTVLSTGEGKLLFRPASVLQQKEGTLISGHVVARGGFIKEHPEALKVYLEEFARASRFIRENPKEAGAVFARVFPGVVTPEVFEYAIDHGLVYLNSVKPRPEDWEKFVKTTNRYGLTKIDDPAKFAEKYVRPDFVE